MSRVRFTALAATAVALTFSAQALQAQHEMERSVESGGISVPGWMGAVQSGMVSDASLAMEGDALHVTTGPAITYWNPENTASGDYTVRATFTEPHYMNLNNHPHPYGIVIAGNHMDTDQRTYLYCAAYGTGAFIVRGFGPEPFQMNGRRPTENPAVHKAAGQGEPVTQEIAVSVRDGKVSCSINGTEVASYDRSEVVADGKLESTDGVYGIRFAHNTEGLVKGLTVEQH